MPDRIDGADLLRVGPLIVKSQTRETRPRMESVK
jgi:hypothetical protein